MLTIESDHIGQVSRELLAAEIGASDKISRLFTLYCSVRTIHNLLLSGTMTFGLNVSFGFIEFVWISFW